MSRDSPLNQCLKISRFYLVWWVIVAFWWVLCFVFQMLQLTLHF
uniref:Uncharacterized protein n=1 Tax=Rhizophora mucronata TaxID=61149 RepID=A0A2P2NSA8_RHIMU